MIEFPILTLLVLVPAVGSVLVALISKRYPDLVRVAALVASVLTGGLSLWVLFAFKSQNADFQFVSQHTWIKPWGISWHLGVDGISLFLVVLTGVLFPLVIAGVDPHHDHKRYLSWMLMGGGGGLGWLMSLDVLRLVGLVCLFLGGVCVFGLFVGLGACSAGRPVRVVRTTTTWISSPSAEARSSTRWTRRRRCSPRCAPPGLRTCPCRCGYPRTTGWKAASHPPTRWKSPAPSRPQALT